MCCLCMRNPRSRPWYLCAACAEKWIERVLAGADGRMAEKIERDPKNPLLPKDRGGCRLEVPNARTVVAAAGGSI